MPNSIKQYSSQFATKLNFVLEFTSVTARNVGKINVIESITKEKDTTIKNWLFNGKLPRLSKRLQIADSLGVSEEYLFNNAIEIKDVKKPMIIFQNNCYLVPFYEEKKIFDLKNLKIAPVSQRIPVMFPAMSKLVELYGKHIYATKVKNSNFKPYIENESLILYSDNIIYEPYKFIIFLGKNNDLLFKRLIEVDKTLMLLSYDSNDNEIIERIKETENVLALVMAVSYEMPT